MIPTCCLQKDLSGAHRATRTSKARHSPQKGLSKCYSGYCVLAALSLYTNSSRRRAPRTCRSIFHQEKEILRFVSVSRVVSTVTSSSRNTSRKNSVHDCFKNRNSIEIPSLLSTRLQKAILIIQRPSTRIRFRGVLNSHENTQCNSPASSLDWLGSHTHASCSE